MWFKYNSDYTKFESNEKLYLTDPFSSEISTYQLDISPFNKQMAMLVMTSPNEELLRESSEYLSLSKKIMKLNGDSEIIDKYGNIRSFKMKSPNEKPVFKKIQEVDTTAKVLIIMLLVVILLIVFIIIMFSRKYKKLDKNNKDHKTFENKLKRLIRKK